MNHTIEVEAIVTGGQVWPRERGFITTGERKRFVTTGGISVWIASFVSLSEKVGCSVSPAYGYRCSVV